MSDLNSIIKDAQLAIENWEDRDAKNILTELRKVVADQQIAQTNPSAYAKLQKWIVYLQLVAFPKLSDEECAEILKNNYLDSFAINVPMEIRITAKLFFIPYLVRDELREKLKRGLSSNGQLLGDQTVGQWIQEFEKEFNVHTRNESAPVQFVLQNPKASSLSREQQHMLKEMLHTYDYLLVSTLPALGEDLKNLMNSGILENETELVVRPPTGAVRNFGVERQPRLEQTFAESSEAKSQPVQVTFSKALSDYPHLGEQQVTTNPFKLRVFPTPVRPSIKNWVTDYHDAMGAGKHSPIDRGNYLFHGENGKKLTAPERQKLSTILKALDEDSIVTVDPNAQVIVFAGAEEMQPPTTNQQPQIQKSFSAEADPPMGRLASDKFSSPRYVQGGNDNAQQDVFERFAPKGVQNSQQAAAGKSFSPNFASVESLKSIGGDVDGSQNNPPQKLAEPQRVNFPQQVHFPVNDMRRPDSSGAAYFNDFASAQKEEKIPEQKIAAPVPSMSKVAVSFSSPQKLPVERTTAAPAAPIQKPTLPIQPAGQTSRPTAQQPSIQAPVRPTQPTQVSPEIKPLKPPVQTARPAVNINPYHIAPSRYLPDESYEEKKPSDTKNAKNVVDLRNHKS